MKLPTNQLLCGNCIDLLEQFPKNSIDLIITSPPYWKQRDYELKDTIGNERRWEDYIEHLSVVFSKCVTILKDTGHIVFNIGDKYINGSLLLLPFQFAINVFKRNKNVKLINNTTWIKSNPTPRQFNRRLISSTEPFFDFVKSDEYYFDPEAFLVNDKKASVEINKTNIGQSYFSMISNSDLTADQKENATVQLKRAINDVKSGKITGMRMKIKGIHSAPFGGNAGGWNTKFNNDGFIIMRHKGKDLKRDVIESSVETIKGIKHPAVYPEFVISELIRLLCPLHGVVLDPFVGSGTTCISAKKEARNFVGIDINPNYIEIAKNRLKSTSNSIFKYMK